MNRTELLNYRFAFRYMQEEIQMHTVKTHTVFVKGNLVLLVFLFATLFANFCFPVVAYPYNNTKNNSSGNLYSSRSAINSYRINLKEYFALNDGDGPCWANML
jgi:hypothetical protein